MFDINSIQSTQTASLAILHPVTKAKLGPIVILRSAEHPARQAAAMQLSRDGVKLGELKTEDDFEQRSEQVVRFLASCMEGWSGFAEGKKPIEFSEPAARKLLAKPEMAWLRNQIFTELNKEENFIQASEKASVPASSTTSA